MFSYFGLLFLRGHNRFGFLVIYQKRYRLLNEIFTCNLYGICLHLYIEIKAMGDFGALGGSRLYQVNFHCLVVLSVRTHDREQWILPSKSDATKRPKILPSNSYNNYLYTIL